MPSASTNDLVKARREAAELLGLDPARPMCPADSLRVDLVSTLRLIIDAAGETVLEGGTADIGRLVGAVEQLTKLLPKTVEPVSHRADPRKALLEMILTMRERGEIADRAEEPTLRERIVALEAALAAKDAELAALRAGAPSPGSPPAPAGGNVVPLPRGAPAWAAPAPAAPAYDYDANTEWKSYVNSDGSIRSTPRGSPV